MWFIASHTPMSKDTITKISNITNKYFRKNKKITSVSLAKRTLPNQFGGLGQIEVETQLNNLLLKWVIKAKAGDEHPWTDFWSYNCKMLQKHLKTSTDLECLDVNWNRIKNCEELFHLTIPIFKAWHKTKFKFKYELNEI